MSGILEDMQLLVNVGYRLSNETPFPGWKTGSEFKAARDRE
ncbi:hypothetical protein [Larkinella punicea]|nr:hypothetical protein [Larkinella punicea]